MSYFASFVEEWKDLINGRARLLSLKIIICSDMSVLDWKIYIDSAIFLGSFFPLPFSSSFHFTPSWKPSVAKDWMPDLVECLLLTKHSTSSDKIIEINDTGLTLKELPTNLGSETAVIEDSEP